MGNIFCPDMDIAHLASVARDICPFPNYSPGPHLVNMLSINSSLHLQNHYTAVQSSLTPKQLEDFTLSLRTTFGREGKVTHGGVGVVALSLAVLFDTLARQVRGEWVSESDPIPGLFIKDPRGFYPPHVYTISEYLRLVPHIANNPSRMMEEVERYHKQLLNDDKCLEESKENNTLPVKDDIQVANVLISDFFTASLQYHHIRIRNATENVLVRPDRKSPEDLVFNLNCDPEMADKVLLAEVEKSDDRTKQTFENKVKNARDRKTFLHEIAKLDLTNSIFQLTPCVAGEVELRIAQREVFDLKANALGKWAK